ncbi:MAG: hypothetical protein CVU97_07070 [Firmicutes bacterium HGW-Firmicutes-21]|nr:MAG: hypothetical protein CVU97_07070 [Firmicutes bacterium HGW-Firmicutes-21]
MKKRAFKFIALMMIITLVLSSYSLTVPVFAQEEQDSLISEYSSIVTDLINESEHTRRLHNEETDLYSLVYENDDGTNTMYMFAQPVKFVDENGAVKDKSITLVDAVDERGKYRYKTAANDVKVYLPVNVSDGVLLAYNGINITLSPVSTSIKTSNVEKSDKKTAIYKNIFDKCIDLEYTMLYKGVKEQIILNQYTGIHQFSFNLKTDGMTLCNEEDRWFLKGRDETVFSIGEVFVTDSNGNHNYGSMSAETIRENEEYILTLTVDKEYLTSKDTVYPVYIDPTIILDTTATIDDSILYSGRPNNNYGSNYYLWTGYRDNRVVSIEYARGPFFISISGFKYYDDYTKEMKKDYKVVFDIQNPETADEFLKQLEAAIDKKLK